MSRIPRLAACGRVLVLALAAAAAQAAPIRLGAHLNGPSESPANASKAIATAEILFDDAANTLWLHVEWKNLSSAVTASHIHCCTALSGWGSDAVASAAGVAPVATTTPSFPGFPAGTSGVYDRVFDMSLASSYRAGFLNGFGGDTEAAGDALLRGLSDGKAYLNIHTQQFPGGEIRGFFVVPEPASLGLTLLTLATLALSRRRRR